jgi:hypothetical protein
MNKKIIFLISITSSICCAFYGVNAQTTLGGQEGRNVITTAVPFISFAPDSRSSGMGDAGVATSPDANSAHWNAGKLAFIKNDFGASLSYTPWLGKIVDDMSISYLTGFYKIDRIQTIGVSMRYFDLGSIDLRDINGVSEGIDNPKEFAFDVTYSRQLSENIGVGVTTRYISSNIASQISSQNNTAKTGSSVAVDLGFYFNKGIVVSGKNTDISFGMHVSNVGQKVSYSNEDNADFIPTNLRLGTAFKTSLDPYNSITFALDFNKLLVPTPPTRDPVTNEITGGRDDNRNLLSGIFGSFGDAPGGGKEELNEISIAAGAEYWYREIFAARAGYFFENDTKGGRKYITIGVGFRYQKFGVDFSYLIPPEQNHPLSETIRFSLLFNFAGSGDEEETGN